MRERESREQGSREIEIGREREREREIGVAEVIDARSEREFELLLRNEHIN